MNCPCCGQEMERHSALLSPLGSGFWRGAGWSCWECDQFVPYSVEKDQRGSESES